MLGVETERRFLIRMPAPELLALCESSDIEQTYIISDGGGRARVRRRGNSGRWTYTFTEKKRISQMSRIENEREIDEEEYLALLERADPKRRCVRKTRYIYPYLGQNFEIDVFPFWQDRAIMELELDSEDQTIALPPDISVIKEVTLDGRYTNSSLAAEVPYDDITSQSEVL